METNLETKSLIRRLYKDADPFFIPKDEEKQVKLSKGNPLYGEITHASVQKLLDYLNLSKQDIFYDLGSGAGKSIFQVASLSSVKKSIGVELSEARHSIAKEALLKAKSQNILGYERCTFLNADFLETNLEDATVIYTCSTAFSQKFMLMLARKFKTLRPGLKIITIQELPEHEKFKKLDRLQLDMTWARKVSVHVYELLK